MIGIKLNPKDVHRFSRKRLERAIATAARKAASTSLRDMRSEASKRVRARKRLKAADIKKAMVVEKNRSRDIDSMRWGIRMKGDAVPLIKYPHRASKRKGVSVTVNKGKRTRLPHAFIATMRSGHRGIYERVREGRLPIHERLGSRPVDALLHKGEAAGVRARAQKSFGDTFERIWNLELDKLRAK